MSNKPYKRNNNHKGKNNRRSYYDKINKAASKETETKSVETNSFTNENCIIRGNTIAYSQYYFGLNILEFFTEEDLKNIIRDPMTYNEILRKVSKTLYSTNGTFTNTVDYMCAMPTLDSVIVTYGNDKNKKRKYKEMMEYTLKMIKIKEIMRDALWRDCVEGACYYYFETNVRPQSLNKYLTDYDVDCISEINAIGLNASVISLPADYTRIVEIKNNSYVIAFNLEYFRDLSGENIETKLRRFPKEIRDAYHLRYDDVGKLKEGYKNGNWVKLNNNNTIVHKIKSDRSEQFGRPLVLAAISDILYDDYFVATKRNVLGELNNKVIYETFPEGKDKGTCALTQPQQKKQHDTVKEAIMNKKNLGGTTFISLSSGTKLNALDVGGTDIFDQKYEGNLGDRIARSLGFAASALDGVGSGSYSTQQTNLELVSAQLFQWIDEITDEVNKCINANLIKDKNNYAECKHLPTTYVNKNDSVGFYKDLYLQGKGSLYVWASSTGLSPEVFKALLDQELEDDVENKYPVHKTSYTLSKNDDKGGRPKTDAPTDNTIKSRANNGNAIPTPSDK